MYAYLVWDKLWEFGELSLCLMSDHVVLVLHIK